MEANLANIEDPGRLEALRRTLLLDSPREPSFDRLTSLASRIIGVPVSLVSLVDTNRQFFKSCIGLPEPWATAREGPLSHSFCKHVVATGDPLIVEDAREHELVNDNPAIPDLNVIAYAGIPLMLDNHALGSFCVIDSEPRAWTEREIEILEGLAEAAMTEIELRVTAEELKAAVKERDDILAVVSHDLRTPISLVAAASELAQRKDLSEERRAEQLQIVGRAGRRMERLANDLVELTRMEAGRLELRRQRTPVARLLNNAIETASPRAEEREIDIELKAEDPDLVVDVDPHRIDQALGNLMSNALKFAPAGGTITVAAHVEDDGAHVRFSVADSGPGIPEEHQKRIFRRFHQVNPNDRRGVGLGLSIVQAIVDAHDGELSVESVPGEGATFSFTLPLAA